MSFVKATGFTFLIGEIVCSLPLLAVCDSCVSAWSLSIASTFCFSGNARVVGKLQTDFTSVDVRNVHRFLKSATE